MVNTRTTALAALLTALASANPSKITPCTAGAGPFNGCGGCDNTSAVSIGALSQASSVANFQLLGSESRLAGGGWDVWWSIGQPDPQCKIVITQPVIQSTANATVKGNVIMAAEKPGCYFGHITSHGFTAGYCCGDSDCVPAGAGIVKKRDEAGVPVKRSSAALRRSRYSELQKKRQNKRAAAAALAKREDYPVSSPVDKRTNTWGNAPPPAPPAPAWSCTPGKPQGDVYTKAGVQQNVFQDLTCNSGEICEQTETITASCANTVQNTHEVQVTNGESQSLSVSAGVFLIDGPTASVTAETGTSFSQAVSNSVSNSQDLTVTKAFAQTVQQMPGTTSDMWFTPTLNCTMMGLTCNGAQITVESCVPALDGNGNPSGEAGMMTVG